VINLHASSFGQDSHLFLSSAARRARYALLFREQPGRSVCSWLRDEGWQTVTSAPTDHQTKEFSLLIRRPLAYGGPYRIPRTSTPISVPGASATAIIWQVREKLKDTRRPVTPANAGSPKGPTQNTSSCGQRLSACASAARRSARSARKPWASA